MLAIFQIIIYNYKCKEEQGSGSQEQKNLKKMKKVLDFLKKI